MFLRYVVSEELFGVGSKIIFGVGEERIFGADFCRAGNAETLFETR